MCSMQGNPIPTVPSSCGLALTCTFQQGLFPPAGCPMPGSRVRNADRWRGCLSVSASAPPPRSSWGVSVVRNVTFYCLWQCCRGLSCPIILSLCKIHLSHSAMADMLFIYLCLFIRRWGMTVPGANGGQRPCSGAQRCNDITLRMGALSLPSTTCYPTEIHTTPSANCGSLICQWTTGSTV